MDTVPSLPAFIFPAFIRTDLIKHGPVCDRIGNSGRNRNRIAMIWPEPEPEPEPDCHPKKVAGFDRIGRI